MFSWYLIFLEARKTRFKYKILSFIVLQIQNKKTDELLKQVLNLIQQHLISKKLISKTPLPLKQLLKQHINKLRYNNQMKNKKESVSRKRYSQISLKKRQILVNSVIQLEESLTKVAKKLKIKLSTAKLILKKYKKTGVLFNKRLRNAKKQPSLYQTSPKKEQALPIVPILEYKEKNIELFPQDKGNNTPPTNMNPVEVCYYLNSLLHQQWGCQWPGLYFLT